MATAKTGSTLFLLLLATSMILYTSPGVQAQSVATVPDGISAGEVAAVFYGIAQIGDHEVFFREAGSPQDPSILLLHGYPSSSHMFRDLISLLAGEFHVVAPDFPGFGYTISPERAQFDYTFDNLAEVIEGFTAARGLDRFAIYMFDYGAPVGMRIASRHPDRISAIISQNGNVYAEGLTDGWAPIEAYWAEPSKANRDALRAFQSEQVIAWQYRHGVPSERLSRIGMDGIKHDLATFSRPEGSEIQLDLFKDYQTNVASYPAWQAYLAEHAPPVLAVWARNDPFFGQDGAFAFSRDVPDAEVHLLDTGHFALETHAAEIAALMTDFLKRHPE